MYPAFDSGSSRWLIVIAICLLAVPALQAQGEAAEKQSPRQWNCVGDPDVLPRGDPSLGEIPLAGAAPTWNAFHLFTSDTWRLHNIGAGFLSREAGSPQVVVMDEEGRCIILQEDSGKWSPHLAVKDDSPISAWACGDLDPCIEGTEIYVGGRSGRIFRVTPQGRDYLAEEVGSAPGGSLSMFVLGDVDPGRAGNELIAFTNNGPVYDLRPDLQNPGKLVVEQIGDLGTRTRDVALLPVDKMRGPRIAALLQTGEVTVVGWTPEGISRRAMCREPMSIARLARKPARPGAPEVIYVARTDGLILRFEETDEGEWKREPIYAGPSGPRGLAAGHFNADHEVETVAVFGYSKKVQVLSRLGSEPWSVETVFTDSGGGHWLTAAELDGRNNTDELVGGGFSYHVFMLGREPGHGLVGVAVDPDRGIPDYPIPGEEGGDSTSAVPGGAPVVSSVATRD